MRRDDVKCSGCEEFAPHRQFHCRVDAVVGLPQLEAAAGALGVVVEEATQTSLRQGYYSRDCFCVCFLTCTHGCGAPGCCMATESSTAPSHSKSHTYRRPKRVFYTRLYKRYFSRAYLKLASCGRGVAAIARLRQRARRRGALRALAVECAAFCMEACCAAFLLAHAPQ